MAQIFSVTWDQKKYRFGVKIFNTPPPPSQPKLNFRQRRGASPNEEKFNQLRFGSKFWGNLRPTKDCYYRWKSPPPQAKSQFWAKKGGQPKLGKNSTNSDLAQTFRVTSDQQKIVIKGENLPPPLSQNSILGKKRGGHPKLGKNSTNSDLTQNFRVTSDQQ